MTTSENHHTHALNILAANQAVTDALPAAHARYHVARDGGIKPDAMVRAAREVAAREAMIRQGNKLAEIHALLHIGDRLDALVKTIDAQRLTPAEMDYLLAHPETSV